MPQIPKVFAIHEAGHAVFGYAAGRGQKIKHIQITPEDPKQGGRVEWDYVKGTPTPFEELHSEFGTKLAGPLAELLLAPEEIADQWITKLQVSLVSAIKTEADLRSIRGGFWGDDLADLVRQEARLKIPYYGRAETFIPIRARLGEPTRPTGLPAKIRLHGGAPV